MGYSPWRFKESDTTEQLNNDNNSNNSVIMSLSICCRGRQREEMVGGGPGRILEWMEELIGHPDHGVPTHQV